MRPACKVGLLGLLVALGAARAWAEATPAQDLPMAPDLAFHEEQSEAAPAFEAEEYPVYETPATLGFAQTGTQSFGPAAGWSDQPTGALTGVTVFCSAGHGWSADGSSWVLQRPLLLDMVEDHGNVDQLNYLVRYLYNAGATVVPFRPVGYQTAEVVLDNDDPGVTFSGAWTDNTTAPQYYENGQTLSGVAYRWATTDTAGTATARYSPAIPATGFYPVYAWPPDGTDRVRQAYDVTHSGGTTRVLVDHRLVGKGWVWLGNYHFEAGTNGYVEISSASPDTGVVIADAIRIGNGMGDLVGVGPNTVSGYSREEEASRYWAESEAGLNAVGLPSAIWDCCPSDISDNVGTAARWGAVMNRQDVNDDRWRRIYLDLHTNAAGCNPPPCGAKGTIALVHDNLKTTHQVQYATILGDKVEADMLQLSGSFEYPWAARSNPYSGDYGSISTANNGNEFDSTLLEVAFHDNIEDTANLLNPTVRAAVARSTVNAMIMFLSGLPGSTIPLIFPPEPPDGIMAIAESATSVRLSWQVPPSGGPYGDAPTAYKLYRSANGYGFDNGMEVGDVTSILLNGLSPGDTLYLRVTAVNTGGESMPSETLAVRPAPLGSPRVLIVNGFDRVSRLTVPRQTIPAGVMRRPIIERTNTRNYVIQHAEALAGAGLSFDSSSDERAEDEAVLLANYDAVVWILGTEGLEAPALTATEQALLTSYLNAGGRLFITGSEIAADLDDQNRGRVFFETMLGGNFLANDSGSKRANGITGTVFAGLPAFYFGASDASPYEVALPDAINPQPGAVTAMRYVARIPHSAGIQFDPGAYRAITIGFPFESILEPSDRLFVMRRAMAWLIGIPVGDFDGDGDVDLDDFALLQRCLTGSDSPQTDLACQATLLDDDTDVDADDLMILWQCFNGAGLLPDPRCAD